MCQPSAHRPVRPHGHPSIFPSSACLLHIPESCILLRYVNDVTFSVSCTEWQLQIVCIYQNTLLRLNTGAFDIIVVTLGGSVTQTSVVNSAAHSQIHCVSGSVFRWNSCISQCVLFCFECLIVLSCTDVFVAVFNILCPWSFKCNCERHWNFAFLNVCVPALNVWKWPPYRISGRPNSLLRAFGFHKVLFGYWSYFGFQNIPPFFGYILILVLIECLHFLSWHSFYPCSWKAHLFDFCGLSCRCPLFRSMYLGRHCRKCLIETQFACLFPKQWVSYCSTTFWNLLFSTNSFTV